ncbi:MAG TPA: hypothetical protein VKP65_04125 [Rhodothermales bacterium]|nr:hypothetical protein [Rhodothermales bacterium]
MTFRFLFACLLIVGLFNTSHLYGQSQQDCGLMVMAHGGSEAWDAAVETAVAPLRADMPTALAFGMADPTTLQAAVTDLEKQEVECIAVVRLFASAQSFLHQTEYLLGLREEQPRFFISHGAHHQNDGKPATPSPIPVKATIKLSQKGLLDAPEMGTILADRALEMSNRSGNESVLILAHGPGDDAENEAWLRKLNGLADSVRATGLFTAVEVHTLREDWPEKRAIAEQRIRAFVKKGSKHDGRVLVIPFRLFGFGPYEKVLEGLPYEATGTGLLPSTKITEWIRSQAQEIIEASEGSTHASGSQ